MSDLTRCLLDKVTARRMVEGLLGLAEGREISEEELLALDLYERARLREFGCSLYCRVRTCCDAWLVYLAIRLLFN